MSDLIGRYQTCAVRGRSINHNLWLLRDIVYFANNRDIPCALVSLDQEKAFDRVDHNFLWKVMKGFSLSNDFMKWVKLLYNGACGKVMVNGFSSDTFPINCGVRQGCPLSPLLYVLFGEVLTRSFITADSFKGFSVPGGVRIKCVAYADDLTCIVSDTCSFRAIKVILHKFELAVGARLNMLKTCGLRLGKWRHKSLPFDAVWSDDELKINGIYFGADMAIQSTWKDRISKLGHILDDFCGRNFTLFGKIAILNCFILPILWYPGTVYPLSVAFAKRIEELIFDLIWSGKTELVCRNIVYRNVKEGGLGLIHFSSNSPSYSFSFPSKCMMPLLTIICHMLFMFVYSVVSV